MIRRQGETLIHSVLDSLIQELDFNVVSDTAGASDVAIEHKNERTGWSVESDTALHWSMYNFWGNREDCCFEEIWVMYVSLGADFSSPAPAHSLRVKLELIRYPDSDFQMTLEETHTINTIGEWNALVEDRILPWIALGRQYEEEDQEMASEGETDREED